MRQFLTFVIGLLCGAATLIAFGYFSGRTDARSDARVMATVDGVAITETQVNAQVARGGSERNAGDAILKRLIDRQLLAAAAVAGGLTDKPIVADALADTRNQVLAQLYLDEQLRKIPPPTDTAIANYYADHPELFSARKIYRIQEIAIEAPRDRFPAIDAQYSRMKNLNDLANWLAANGIPHRTKATELPAESLPSDLVPHLVVMTPGETRKIANDSGLTVLQLVGSLAAPQSLDEARASIAAFLNNRDKAEVARTVTESLRARAKIVYNKEG